MGFGSSEVSIVSRPAPFASAQQLSLSLAGTWRSQLIAFLYQDCEMDLVVGIKSRSITKAHCFAIDEAFLQRFSPFLTRRPMIDNRRWGSDH
jgi:hypothetical protein